MLLQNLKEVLTVKIPEKQQEVIAFRKEHGKTKVGEVTVDMVSAERSRETFESYLCVADSIHNLMRNISCSFQGCFFFFNFRSHVCITSDK